MTLKFFQKLYGHSEFDEIKIIGKDIVKEGRPYHIIGLVRKKKQVMLYVLGLCEPMSEHMPYSERNRREQMKSSMQSERNHSFFLRIRSFHCGELQYEVSSANSGPCRNSDYAEVYLLFMKMLQAGWRVTEESPFYNADWDNLSITNIELREKMEQLPEWRDDMCDDLWNDVWVSFDTAPVECALELPLLLEVEKSREISFAMQDGRDATCYINRVYLLDVWADEEQKFKDPDYRQRMLQHMTEAELENVKTQLFEALVEICPRGMCFPVVEYECTEDVGLRFFDREYLDTSEKTAKGKATSVIMRAKPKTETGSHGLKLRTCVIQSPVKAGTETIDVELFSYTAVIQKKVEKLNV